MQNKKRTRVGSEAQYGPRSAGEILHDYLENSNEPLATAYRERASQKHGWHKNTDLAVNLKTVLHSDTSMRTGRDYQGVLRRDCDAEIEDFRCRDAHYTFTETLPWTTRRNPRVYRGRFITVTRRQDGSLRLNFRPVAMGSGFSVERYAFGVYREIRQALVGLVGENDVRSKM